MNIKLLTQCAAWLEAGAPHVETPNGPINGFDMSYFFNRHVLRNACRTTCCIAGYVLQIAGEGENSSGPCFTDAAADLLEMDELQAQQLFDPESISLERKDHIDGPNYIRNHNITPDWAARATRHLIATGEVDWEATRDAALPA